MGTFTSDTLSTLWYYLSKFLNKILLLIMKYFFIVMLLVLLQENILVLLPPVHMNTHDALCIYCVHFKQLETKLKLFECLNIHLCISLYTGTCANFLEVIIKFKLEFQCWASILKTTTERCLPLLAKVTNYPSPIRPRLYL